MPRSGGVKPPLFVRPPFVRPRPARPPSVHLWHHLLFCSILTFQMPFSTFGCEALLLGGAQETVETIACKTTTGGETSFSQTIGFETAGSGTPSLRLPPSVRSLSEGPSRMAQIINYLACCGNCGHQILMALLVHLCRVVCVLFGVEYSVVGPM